MIKVLGKLPIGNFGVAVSGGVDSMAVLDFLLKSNRKPKVLYFNHGTEHGKEAYDFVFDYCTKNNLEFISEKITDIPTKNKEKAWSDARYSFFSKFDFPIITCHHLDDCVETYIFSALRGFLSVIPYRRGNVIRPFLLTKKSDFMKWCINKNVSWIEDKSNESVEYSRNRIRHNIIPEAMEINKGLHNTVSKFVKKLDLT